MWYSPLLFILKAAWEWLKKDYHWVWVLLAPLGVIILVARFTGPRLQVVSSESVGADKVKEDIENNLRQQDQQNEVVREKETTDAQKAHEVVIQDEVKKEQAQNEKLLADPDALTQTMLQAGKDARQ